MSRGRVVLQAQDWRWWRCPYTSVTAVAAPSWHEIDTESGEPAPRPRSSTERRQVRSSAKRRRRCSTLPIGTFPRVGTSTSPVDEAGREGGGVGVGGEDGVGGVDDQGRGGDGLGGELVAVQLDGGHSPAEEKTAPATRGRSGKVVALIAASSVWAAPSSRRGSPAASRVSAGDRVRPQSSGSARPATW